MQDQTRPDCATQMFLGTGTDYAMPSLWCPQDMADLLEKQITLLDASCDRDEADK